MSKQQSSSTLDQVIAGARAGQSSYSEEEWRQRLGAFLHAHGEDRPIVELKRPAGGASAASIIFSLEPPSAQSKHAADRYVARLKPEASFWSVFDVVEQFTVQQSLHNAGLPVPAALWLDEAGRYLGRPGYVMEFAAGISSTPAYFSDGPLSNLPAAQRFKMMRNMLCTLADFHRLANPKLECLVVKGLGNSWIEREINNWFDLVDYAQPELTSRYKAVRDWLVDTAPAVPDPVVIHGDYQGSNVLWIGEEISAVLDFEAVRIGPRESDVAHQCIMDELSARLYGGLDIELPTLEQRGAWYEEASGVKLTNLDYHFTRAVFQFACGGVGLTRGTQQDYIAEPTPFMDYINRRVLGLLPASLPFKPDLPVART